MPGQYLQSSGKKSLYGVPSPQNFTWGPPAAGNGIVALVSNYFGGGNPTLTSVTDNAGNGTYAVAHQNHTVNDLVAIAYKLGILTASPFTSTVTVSNATSSNYFVMGAAEFSGLLAFDQSGYATNGGSANALTVSTSGSVTGGPQVMVSQCTLEASLNTVIAVPSGWNLLWQEVNSAGVIACAAYKIGVLSGVQSCPWTWDVTTGAGAPALADIATFVATTSPMFIKRTVRNHHLVHFPR
jgi:hypothetical protein